MLIPLLITLICIICMLWIVGWIFRTDCTIPTISIETYKRILVLFPHPDDEVLTCGGMLSRASHNGACVHLHIFTKGERGTPDGSENPTLKTIRAHEAVTVARILGINTLVHHDLGDRTLAEKTKFLNNHIEKTVTEFKPDLVITYDTSGLYGHPDHIAVSQGATEIVQRLGRCALWYASMPKRIMKLVALPEHMANDPEFAGRRLYPTHKVTIGFHIISVIRALYAYKSQYQSFRHAFPFPWIPLWFLASMSTHEYFHKV